MKDDFLHPLLDFLNEYNPSSECEWGEWQITPVTHGRNNRLFRAVCDVHDLVVKFTIRDDRNRAVREYDSLRVIQDAGLSIAPMPVMCDKDRYELPVMVQTWHEGPVHGGPPEDDAAWQRFVEHYVAIQSITEAGTGQILPDAIANTGTLEAVIEYHINLVSYIPEASRPAVLDTWLPRLKEMGHSAWPPPPRTLCRSDPNPLNMIRHTDGWMSVDWEYGGWGDPASDIGEVMTFPEYIEVPDERWEWFIDTYCAHTKDEAMRNRIHTYRKILTMDWVARFARSTIYDSTRLPHR